MIEDIEKSAAIFKALSHPARIEILMLLSRNKQLSVLEFVKELNLAQSTVSVHLNMLKTANLIKCESVATKSVYSIKTKSIEKLDKTIKKLFKQILE